MFRKLMCFFFNHKLKKVKGYDEGYMCKLYCVRCKRYFGINHQTKSFLPWDDDLENIYRVFNQLEGKDGN